MEPETALELARIIALYRAWTARKGRRFGVHPINAARNEKGQFHSLVYDLREDAERFRLYTRMSLEAFDKLLDLVEQRLVKRSNREALSPEHRLIVTLRFLSCGDSFASLATNFRIGISTACNVVHEVCAVLVDELSPTYLATPTTAAEWAEVADGFCGKWQLPNALGAIDGKHIAIRAPANSGSLYLANLTDEKRIFNYSSNSYGARSFAWQTIAYKLNVADRALDLRRMWRGWLRSYVNYRLRSTSRKPKYYQEMHYMHACSQDHILSLKYRF